MSEHMSGQSCAQTTRMDFATPVPPKTENSGERRLKKTAAFLLLGRALSWRLFRLGAGRLGACAHTAGHAEAVLEALHSAATVDALAHAGPGRMGLGIDIQAQRGAFLAPGRLRLEGRAVGHDH